MLKVEVVRIDEVNILNEMTRIKHEEMEPFAKDHEEEWKRLLNNLPKDHQVKFSEYRKLRTYVEFFNNLKLRIPKANGRSPQYENYLKATKLGFIPTPEEQKQAGHSDLFAQSEDMFFINFNGALTASKTPLAQIRPILERKTHTTQEIAEIHGLLFRPYTRMRLLGYNHTDLTQ